MVLNIRFLYSAFKESIHTHLGNFGGGSFGNLIGPNTMGQYSFILFLLRDIESDPYMQVQINVQCVISIAALMSILLLQALAVHIGRPLAICAMIMDRSGAVSRLPIPPPNPPLVRVFE